MLTSNSIDPCGLPPVACRSRLIAIRTAAYVAVAVCAATGALAQEATPAKKRELQRYVERAPAVLVNPAVIQRPAEVPLERAPDADPPTVESPALDSPAASATDTVVAPAVTSALAPVTFASKLTRGELAYVPLAPAQEATAKVLLNEKLAVTDSESIGTVQSFEGAVRQLATDEREVQLKPYVLVGQPLQYVEESGQFVGTVLIGVADLFGDVGPRVLTVPLQFEVLESALVDPQRVSLTETSPPYERIQVRSRVVGQPVTISIASNFSREGVKVSVPVEPTLIVNIDGGNLRAFGIQTTRISVTAVGGSTATGTPVQLSAPGAYLPDEAIPKLDDSGFAFATLRTDSPGRITVTATAAGYAPGTRSVDVIWPWPTLIATCLGGFIGGFVRLGSRIRKGMKVGQFAVGLIASISIGAIVFALYLVGVKLLPVTFSVEIGDIFAFAVAALAGWLGVTVLPQRKTGIA